MAEKRAIILIGPIGAGKSTIGELLAERLNLPRCSMDEVRWGYYTEIGFSEETQSDIGAREGTVGVYRYWKQFEIYAVERVLEDHQDCVIDFGAGHSVYEDEAYFARAQKALADYPNVIMLLPSPDLDESVRILHEGEVDGLADGMDFHEHFVKHPSNHRLAKHVVYTKGKTPEETCTEVLKLLGLDKG